MKFWKDSTYWVGSLLSSKGLEVVQAVLNCRLDSCFEMSVALCWGRSRCWFCISALSSSSFRLAWCISALTNGPMVRDPFCERNCFQKSLNVLAVACGNLDCCVWPRFIHGVLPGMPAAPARNLITAVLVENSLEHAAHEAETERLQLKKRALARMAKDVYSLSMCPGNLRHRISILQAQQSFYSGRCRRPANSLHHDEIGPRTVTPRETFLALSCSAPLSLWYTSVDRSVKRSISLSIYLSVCLVFLSNLSTYLSTYISTYLSKYLSIYLSFFLSIYLSVCLSACLSLFLSI